MGGEDLRERERERREERGEGRSPVIGGGGGGGGKERLFLGVLNLGRFLDSSFQRGFALLCFALLCFASLLALTRRKGSEAERRGWGAESGRLRV